MDSSTCRHTRDLTTSTGTFPTKIVRPLRRSGVSSDGTNFCFALELPPLLFLPLRRDSCTSLEGSPSSSESLEFASSSSSLRRSAFWGVSTESSSSAESGIIVVCFPGVPALDGLLALRPFSDAAVLYSEIYCVTQRKRTVIFLFPCFLWLPQVLFVIRDLLPLLLLACSGV